VGAAYAGFQGQPGKVTVQSTLEQAIFAVTQEDVRVVGSGRTDAGAHALGQVVAFDTARDLPCDTLLHALNAHLPEDVRVVVCEEATPTFNPRHDALSRTYRYVIWNRPTHSPFLLGRAAHVRKPLDETTMHLALQTLVGPCDVSAFVPVSTEGSRTRTIFDASCRRDGHLVMVEVTASGFMKQMMRALVGTLVTVGTGRLAISEFLHIVQSGDRSLAGTTAPACGLYLVEVSYDEHSQTGSVAENGTFPCGSYEVAGPVEQPVAPLSGPQRATQELSERIAGLVSLPAADRHEEMR